MRSIARTLSLIGSAAAVIGMLSMPATVAYADQDMIAAGKQLAFNRKKGNCLACHAIDDGVTPGNLGPPLFSMKQRFSSKAALRAQIWDATRRNANTPMPPFGRHEILAEAEISKIASYIWSL